MNKVTLTGHSCIRRVTFFGFEGLAHREECKLTVVAVKKGVPTSGDSYGDRFTEVTNIVCNVKLRSTFIRVGSFFYKSMQKDPVN